MNGKLSLLRVGAVAILLALVVGGELVQRAKTERAEETGVKVISAVVGEYRPGHVPQSIGKPLRAMRDVADAYERLHPDVRVRFRSVAYTDTVEGEWIRTQLLGDTAPEIVAINVEAVWPDVDKGWWVSLEPFMIEPNPYVPGNRQWWDQFANLPLTRAKRGPDRQLYCVAYDMVETGIIYNADIFREVGVKVPADWEEFLEMQRKLKDAGYIPLLVHFQQAADWAQDIILDQLYYPILEDIDIEKGTPEEEEYLAGYLFPKELCYDIKRGYFDADYPRWREVWRLMLDWRRYWQKDIAVADRNRLFLTKTAAMMWEGSWSVRRMLNDPLVDFDWGVFYLPPMTKATSRFAERVDPAVIGGAAMQLSVTRTAISRGTLDTAIDFLRFICEPRNAEKIIGEAGLFIPNIKGAKLIPQLAPFEDILEKRYCTVKMLYSLSQEFTDRHTRMITLFLNGGISLDEFMVEMENYFHTLGADYYINKYGWDFRDYDAILASHEIPYKPQR